MPFEITALVFFSDFIRHECKFFVQTSELHLITSFMKLYSCLLDEIRAQEHAEGPDRMSANQVCTGTELP